MSELERWASRENAKIDLKDTADFGVSLVVLASLLMLGPALLAWRILKHFPFRPLPALVVGGAAVWVAWALVLSAPWGNSHASNDLALSAFFELLLSMTIVCGVLSIIVEVSVYPLERAEVATTVFLTKFASPLGRCFHILCMFAPTVVLAIIAVIGSRTAPRLDIEGGAPDFIYGLLAIGFLYFIVSQLICLRYRLYNHAAGRFLSIWGSVRQTPRGHVEVPAE